MAHIDALPEWSDDLYPYIVVIRLAEGYYEARVAGLTAPFGTGSNPEEAVADLCRLLPSATGLLWELW